MTPKYKIEKLLNALIFRYVIQNDIKAQYSYIILSVQNILKRVAVFHYLV